MTKQQVEKLKTVAIITLGILVFFGIIYIVSEHTGDRSKDKEIVEKENPLLEDGEVLKEEEQSELTSISMSDLKNALENKEKKLVMLGTETCYWCIQQKPILKSIVYKYQVEIDYMDLNALSSEEYTELTTLHESLQAFGTPTFIIVDQGSVIAVEVGGQTTAQITQILKQHGFIN